MYWRPKGAVTTKNNSSAGQCKQSAYRSKVSDGKSINFDELNKTLACGPLEKTRARPIIPVRCPLFIETFGKRGRGPRSLCLRGEGEGRPRPPRFSACVFAIISWCVLQWPPGAIGPLSLPRGSFLATLRSTLAPCAAQRRLQRSAAWNFPLKVAA